MLMYFKSQWPSWVAILIALITLPVAGEVGQLDGDAERTFESDMLELLDHARLGFANIKGAKRGENETMIQWQSSFGITSAVKPTDSTIMLTKGDAPRIGYVTLLGGARSFAMVAKKTVNYQAWIETWLEANGLNWRELEPIENKHGDITVKRYGWKGPKWPGHATPPQIHLMRMDMGNGTYQLMLRFIVPMFKTDDGSVTTYADEFEKDVLYLLEQSKTDFNTIRGKERRKKGDRTTYECDFAVLGADSVYPPRVTKGLMHGKPMASQTTYLIVTKDEKAVAQYLDLFNTWMSHAIAKRPGFERKPDNKTKNEHGEMIRMQWIQPPGPLLRIAEVSSFPLKNNRTLFAVSISAVEMKD